VEACCAWWRWEAEGSGLEVEERGNGGREVGGGASSVFERAREDFGLSDGVGACSVAESGNLNSAGSLISWRFSKRRGLVGDLGGVARSSSRSSGIMVAAGDDMPMLEGAEGSVAILEPSSLAVRRRLTTRVFRFRDVLGREPSPRPFCVEEKLWSVGREEAVSFPVLSDARDGVVDFWLPNEDCMRERLESVRDGVAAPELSLRSPAPAQARNTVSRIEGVKSDSVW